MQVLHCHHSFRIVKMISSSGDAVVSGHLFNTFVVVDSIDQLGYCCGELPEIGQPFLLHEFTRTVTGGKRAAIKEEIQRTVGRFYPHCSELGVDAFQAMLRFSSRGLSSATLGCQELTTVNG